MGVASTGLAEQRPSRSGEAHDGMGPYHGRLQCLLLEWTERNQQTLEATSREIRSCPGLWILAGDFNMEPETFGQYATPTRLPGVLVKSAVPTFRHGVSVRCFDYFDVHRAVACQVLEVRVLDESGSVLTTQFR